MGNEQNHKIVLGDEEDAKKIIKFIEAVLINLYELPKEIEQDDQE